MTEETTNKKQPFKKIDYTKVDPILKDNPKISWEEFKGKCSETMSKWTFSNRKIYLLTGKQYGDRTRKTDIISTDTTSTGTVTLQHVFDKCIPPKTSMRKEYKKIAAILFKDNTLTYASFVEKKQVKMCDNSFFKLRKKIVALMNNGEKVEPEKQEVQTITPKRKKILYSIIFEKEIEGMSNESRELLQQFINELNTRKNMGLEIAEVIFPIHKVEVRSYS